MRGKKKKRGTSGRIGLCLALLLVVLCFTAGCGLDGGDGARMPMDFTVVEPEKVPKELAKVIEEHKQEEMQIAFTDQGSLYVVRGYGKQNTGGYSIAVDECSEGEKNVHVATTLIGPTQTEKISKEPSYPVIVIKMENRDKEVSFE